MCRLEVAVHWCMMYTLWRLEVAVHWYMMYNVWRFDQRSRMYSLRAIYDVENVDVLWFTMY